MLLDLNNLSEREIKKLESSCKFEKMEKITFVEKPLMRTEFLASSDISQVLNFQTCAAILCSSMRGSVMCGKKSNLVLIKIERTCEFAMI